MTKNKLNDEIAFHLKKLINEFTDIDWAEDLAQQAHNGQYRKVGKKPYIIHPKRVQLNAKALGYGKEIQLLSILHDVMEDSKNPETFGKKIINKLGINIYNDLMLLTHDDSVKYDEYLLKLSRTSDNAFKVKMLDMFDNLSDNPSVNQKIKYKNAILYLLNNGINESLIPKSIYTILQLKKASVSESVLLEKDVDKGAKDSEDSNDKESSDKDLGDEKNPIDNKQDSGQSDTKDPFADSPDDMSPDEDKSGDDEDKGESIVKYNEEVAKIKKIKYQNSTEEPGFDFDTNDDSQFEEGYVGISIKGSLIIATPSFNDIYDYNKNKFFKNFVLNRIYKIAKKAVESSKRVVFIGEYGNPVNGDMYKNNEQGIIAKFLSDKFGNKIMFDTWMPNEYESFIDNDKIWKNLKSITNLSGSKIKSALYLYMLLLHGNDTLTQSLMTEKVGSILQSWGIKEIDLDMSYKESIEKIVGILYPETISKPQTEASFIMKTYYHLLLRDLMSKIIRFENSGKVAIIATNPRIAWELAPSVRNIDLILANKE